MWVGSAEDGTPRARAQLVRRAFPERDRERHNAMIGAVQFALGEAFPERGDAFREELLPALERYFVVGGVPVETRRPIAGDLAGDIPRLATSLETRPSIVARWSVEMNAARWTVRAELRAEP